MIELTEQQRKCVHATCLTGGDWDVCSDCGAEVQLIITSALVAMITRPVQRRTNQILDIYKCPVCGKDHDGLVVGVSRGIRFVICPDTNVTIWITKE